MRKWSGELSVLWVRSVFLFCFVCFNLEVFRMQALGPLINHVGSTSAPLFLLLSSEAGFTVTACAVLLWPTETQYGVAYKQQKSVCHGLGTWKFEHGWVGKLASWLTDDCLCARTSHGQGGKGVLWCPFHKGTPAVPEGSSLITQSLLKGPLSDRRLGFQHMNFIGAQIFIRWHTLSFDHCEEFTNHSTSSHPLLLRTGPRKLRIFWLVERGRT